MYIQTVVGHFCARIKQAWKEVKKVIKITKKVNNGIYAV